MILDTNFLVFLERELRRGEDGAACRFLSERRDDTFLITPTVSGELACGLSMGTRARWEEFLAPFPVVGITPDTCWHYGNLYRQLRKEGQLIGSNDLWIAATALAHAQPLVTRNVEEFGRVPGLSVVSY